MVAGDTGVSAPRPPACTGAADPGCDHGQRRPGEPHAWIRRRRRAPALVLFLVPAGRRAGALLAFRAAVIGFANLAVFAVCVRGALLTGRRRGGSKAQREHQHGDRRSHGRPVSSTRDPSSDEGPSPARGGAASGARGADCNTRRRRAAALETVTSHVTSRRRGAHEGLPRRRARRRRALKAPRDWSVPRSVQEGRGRKVVRKFGRPYSAPASIRGRLRTCEAQRQSEAE